MCSKRVRDVCVVSTLFSLNVFNVSVLGKLKIEHFNNSVNLLASENDTQVLINK